MIMEKIIIHLRDWNRRILWILLSTNFNTRFFIERTYLACSFFVCASSPTRVQVSFLKGLKRHPMQFWIPIKKKSSVLS
jgi:hypothetical protein